MEKELLFWCVAGFGLPALVVGLVFAGFSKKAEVQALSQDVTQFWLRWPEWTRGQRIFASLFTFGSSLLLLLLSRLGAIAAEWAAVRFGGLPLEQAVAEPPLGSWSLTAMVVVSCQAMIIVYLEYRRIISRNAD